MNLRTASILFGTVLCPSAGMAEVSPEQACIYFIGIERLTPELRNPYSQPRVVVPMEAPAEGTSSAPSKLGIERYQNFSWEIQSGIFRPEDLVHTPDPSDQVGVMVARVECLVDVVERSVVRILVEPAPPSTNEVLLPNGALVEPREPISQAIEVGNRGHKGRY